MNYEENAIRKMVKMNGERIYIIVGVRFAHITCRRENARGAKINDAQRKIIGGLIKSIRRKMVAMEVG